MLRWRQLPVGLLTLLYSPLSAWARARSGGVVEIPSSWGLTPKRNEQSGKLELIGKDDAGQTYVAHSSDREGVTDETMQDLVRGDREKTDARTFTKYFIEHQRRSR